MPKLLRNRWLRHTLFVAALLALGVGIYQIQPPEPMCEIDTEDVEPVRFLAGGLIATLRRPSHGPLQIWDVRTCTQVARHFSDDDKSRIRLSPDGAITVRSFDWADFRGLEIYETLSGKRLHRHETGSEGHWVEVTDEMVFYDFPVAEDQTQTEIWNVRERKIVNILEGVQDGPVLSPDGRRFIVGRAGPDGTPATQWTVWDVALGRAVAEIPLDLKGPTTISPDGRWIAGAARKGPHIEVRDLASGDLVGVSPVTNVKEIAFSPDGRLLALYVADPEAALVLLEVPSMKTLWTHPGQYAFNKTFFSQDSGTVYAQHLDWDAKYFDCRTGVSFSYGGWAQCNALIVGQSADRRRILMGRGTTTEDRLPAWLHWARKMPGLDRILAAEDVIEIAVIDADSRRKIFRQLIPSNMMALPLLSIDGRLVATVHCDGEQYILRCWDVDAPKPLRWALGLPTGVGCVLWLVAKWLQRRANQAK